MKINLDSEKYYNEKTNSLNVPIGKMIFIGILVLIILSLLGLGLKILLFPAKIAHTMVNTAGKVITKTLDADNVLYNYEWFKQQCEDYKAISIKLEQAKTSAFDFASIAGPRENWTFEDKAEYSRLKSIADGIGYQLEDVKAQYNARSKMLNRNIFKTKDLPYQLEGEM